MTSADGAGRHALIVGGTRGIGLALVRALLDARYAHVTAVSRVPGTAGIETLRQSHPEALSTLTVDITDEAQIEHAAAAMAKTSPRLDLLINCAGLLHDDDLQPERRLLDVQPQFVQRSFAVNALGPLLLAKHLHPLLAHEQRAVLVNVSARVGSIGDNRLGGWYAYRAAKAAQNQITRTLAIELSRRAPNLICVALHPGTVATGLSQPFRGNVDPAKLFSAESAASHLLTVIDGLQPADTGRFFAWDGSEIPW